MECNRDEALRAREIAEKKFSIHDFAGAKKFVLKAQQLYPALEGVPQMLAVMDVHSVAQVKVGGNETDWYGILQVEPPADDNYIKRQYRKLALLLHPDKNKSVGAEAAFKLIGEAFGVLSDKTKRTLHDMKRGIRGKVAQMHTGISETMKSQYPAHHAQHQAAGQATSGSGAQASHAFWTSCPMCRMQYQYLRTYLNFQLLCQKCNKPFLAKDINAPASNGTNTQTWTHGSSNNATQHQAGPVPPGPPQQEHKFSTFARANGVTGTAAGNGSSRAQEDPHTAGSGNKATGSSAAEAAAANLVQEAFQRARKDRMEAEREFKRKEREKDKALRQQEKEAFKKAREQLKVREALERLNSKRKEAAEKKAANILKRRSGKQRRTEEEEEDDDEDEERLEHTNLADSSQVDSSGASIGKSNLRRSARHRRNVMYNTDGSDDDIEAFPDTKKLRTTREGGDFGNGRRIEKGKSVMDDEDVGNEEPWIKGGNGDGEVSRKDGHAREGSSGSANAKEKTKREVLEQLLAEKFRRELAAKVRNSKIDLTKLKSGGKMEGDQELSGRESPGTMGDSGKVTQLSSKLNCKMTMESMNGDGLQPKQGLHKVDDFERTWKDNSVESETYVSAEFCPTVPFVSVPPFLEQELDVPDPDHHDFDSDRTEAHVMKDQIWAVFDDQDGMPRFHCMILTVCRNPFLVTGSWLESTYTGTDPSKYSWLQKNNLSPGCGEFRLVGEGEFDQINMFSHMMKAVRYRNFYEIFPRRHEVWAVFRDFGKVLPKSKTDERVQFRYDLVQVQSDFSMVTRGGSVVALEKMAGYKTLWRTVGDAYPLSVANDLQRFSHLVPSYCIKEKEIPGVPANCLELDPASTPAEMIRT